MTETTRSVRLMDGKVLARRLVVEAADGAAQVRQRTGVAPCLATVLVGDAPASETYVRMKRNRCAKAGIESRHVPLPASLSTGELVEKVSELSRDPGVHGILLQHPAGPHIDERAAFEVIAPEKDVDGVTLSSFAAMSFGLPGFVSCTRRNHAAAGRVRGRPGRQARGGRGAQRDPEEARGNAAVGAQRHGDLLPFANPRPVRACARGRRTRRRRRPSPLSAGTDIKPVAVVIDAGSNPGNVGVVDSETARERARLITPVPGSVGPMTIATLLTQTVEAAARQLAAA